MLVLNLPTIGRNFSDRALQMHAEVGEPYRLSMRQLLHSPPTFAATERIFICENPTVTYAAASRLGEDCAPLMCIDGQPKWAAAVVLNQLASVQVPLVYHGDFDWDGLRIANLLQRRHGTLPWCFLADDYLQPCGNEGLRLEGNPIDALWEPAIKDAMVAQGRVVHEEQVSPKLLSVLDCFAHHSKYEMAR